jgi:spermidine/putrescine transport system permease protein
MKNALQRLILLGPGLTWLALFLVIPLGLVFVYSFFQRGTFGGIVYDFTLENYARVVEPLFLTIFVDSLRIAAITTTLALLISYPAAYFIATGPPNWRTPLLALVVLPFWTSYLIRTYAWIVLLNREGLINRVLLNLGVIAQPLDLLYNEFAIILGLLSGYLPFMILPLYASIERLQPELRDAAANLGAPPWKVFLTISLPLTLSGVIAGMIFVFVPSMGNFFVPELLGGGRQSMAGNLIRDQFLKARDWPFGSTLAFGLMGVIMILLFIQAWLVNRTRQEIPADVR